MTLCEDPLMAVSLHNKRTTTYAELVPCIPDKRFFNMQKTNGYVRIIGNVHQHQIGSR